MAVATGKFLKVSNEIKAIATDLVAADASAGIKFDCRSYANERVMFIAKNEEASTAKAVTVCKPTNGGYAASDEDLTLNLAAGTEAVIWVETAKYANNDGSIIIKGGSANVKVVAVVIG